MEKKKERVVIEKVSPEVDSGAFPIKRVAGEKVVVRADIFADGHDEVSALLLYRKEGKGWREAPMKPLVNDRWEGSFNVEETGVYEYTVRAWVDHFLTWAKDFRKRREAGQDLKVEILIGLEHLRALKARAGGAGGAGGGQDLKRIDGFIKTFEEGEGAAELALGGGFLEMIRKYPDKSFSTTYARELRVVVDRKKALFSTWYEVFPRSCNSSGHGTFKDCQRLLPELSEMGFDVLYLPPIHPIGRNRRKGRDNVPSAGPDDPGSPWAIGSEEGGHTCVHPELGSLKDFEDLVRKAREHGMEVALDLAFQCSHDHPWVREHPEWFRWRPDGTVQFAENPPKKYEDIIPLDFETEKWEELWDELKSVVLFWIERGVRVFRVDNPHTKPFSFWQWLIGEIKRDYPEAIFLSEAFTRPKVMARLAKVGFTQSYTYFTWRNTKQELTEYLEELTGTELREYLRPNFWPNTPDILPEYLQFGQRPSFIIRLVLAATLSSNYGIYGPLFELCINEAHPEREEYRGSEKYEIKRWERDTPGSLRDFIARVNRIRRENPALQTTRNLKFLDIDNDYMLYFLKATEDLSNSLLVVVSLDPFHEQSGTMRIPLEELGISPGQPYLLYDLLGDDRFMLQGETNPVVIDPGVMPARVFRVHSRLRREKDFDYFM